MEEARLYQIHRQIEERGAQIAQAHGDWPCRKGCDDCCRRLAAAPRVSGTEWRAIERALMDLPAAAATLVKQRIRESTAQARPVVCPLLDRSTQSCLVYPVRPAACRAYGFYAERGEVLGCARIEEVARESPDVVWGNHQALLSDLDALGPARELGDWVSEPQGQ